MKVKVDYGDGTEPEELEVTDGSRHFHPFPEGDEEKHTVSVEVLEEDTPEEPAPDEPAPDEGVPDIEEVPPVEPVEPVEPVPDIPIGFDPGAHTIPDVMEYVNAHPDQIDEVLAAEEAGKNRSTLVSQLEALE